MANDDLKNRTKSFAHRCVKMASALPNSALGIHIRGQIIRCATSVAANYRAASMAQSKPSFIAKISIVVEEADEALFWLEFILEENLIGKSQLSPLSDEANELTAIFVTSRKTAQRKK